MLGRNGVGKSSLLRAIVGHQPISRRQHPLERPGLGTPRRPTTAPGAASPMCRRVARSSRCSASRKIWRPASPRCRARTAASRRRSTTSFRCLQSMLGRRGGDLSGGQQQQLAIARALVTRPRLLVLDEPTEGIQPSIIKDIGRAIDYLRRKGEMAILLVEQYFEFARDLCDTFAVMERGQVVMAGDKREHGREAMFVTISPSEIASTSRAAGPPRPTCAAAGGVRVRLRRNPAWHGMPPVLAESGGYRVRFPKGGICEAVLINTGGGMAGGDRMAVGMRLAAGAEAVVTTQSAEKIYRTQRAATEIDVRSRSSRAQAASIWLPQETILFSESRVRRDVRHCARRRRLAHLRRERRLRSHRQGRDHGARRLPRPLARSPRRHAHLRGGRPARRRYRPAASAQGHWRRARALSPLSSYVAPTRRRASMRRARRSPMRTSRMRRQRLERHAGRPLPFANAQALRAGPSLVSLNGSAARPMPRSWQT